MSPRTLLILLVLVAPAAALLLFGPRGGVHVPEGRTVIRYWDKWTGVEGAAVQRLVDKFNDTIGREENLWVDYHALGDVDKRMLMATAGGDPPDVAGPSDRFFVPYADQDVLLPLDELAVEFGVDLALFKPALIEMCKLDDKLYGLPSTPFTTALFYNRKLYRAAGLDPDRPPRTTAEFNEYAIKLTRTERDRIVQLGFTLSPAMLGWWHWAWPMFFDGRLWDGERVTIDSPETRAALDWMMALRSAIGNERALRFEANMGAIESKQNPFLKGDLAMILQGPWLANWARVYAPELDYGVARFPGVREDFKPVFASTDYFVIPRSSKRPREAMRFLAFMMRPENLEQLCIDHGKISPYRTPGPEFFARHKNPYIRVFDELANSERVFAYPKMPAFAEAWTETLYMFETVLRASRPTDEVVKQTQTKVEAIVTDYLRMAELRKGPRARTTFSHSRD